MIRPRATDQSSNCRGKRSFVQLSGCSPHPLTSKTKLNEHGGSKDFIRVCVSASADTFLKNVGYWCGAY
ncbi:hypothetical protein AOLI_G00239690 [Acnodon oligacanthus]